MNKVFWGMLVVSSAVIVYSANAQLLSRSEMRPPPIGFIAGTVTDSITGDPIESALVRVFGGFEWDYDSTDAMGHYIILWLQLGFYDIEASKSGYITQVQPDIEVTPEDTIWVDFQLVPEGPFPCPYVPGDANGDGIFNGLDVTYSVQYLKGGGQPPPNICLCLPNGNLFAAADANGNCVFNGLDITYMVNYLKGIGPAPQGCPDCPPGR